MAAPLPFSESELGLLNSLLKHNVRPMTGSLNSLSLQGKSHLRAAEAFRVAGAEIGAEHFGAIDRVKCDRTAVTGRPDI